MISEKMENIINKQINAELYSAYLYLSMEAYFHSLNLKGFANWMRVQVQEEIFHATKMFTFLNERGGRVKLKPIDGPQLEWKSPIDVFENGLAHENKVTAMINEITDLAIAEHDHASNIFYQWFVIEQVEEEANAEDVIRKLKLVNDTPGGLFMIDKELALRVFVPPATTAGA